MSNSAPVMSLNRDRKRLTQSDLTRIGKYEIRGVAGRGAMGVVYDGWDPVIARRVAIKAIPLPGLSDADAAEGLVRFRQEAQAAGRLSHPNIVSIYEYGEEGAIAYIVMEFVDGNTLKELLNTRGHLSAGEAMHIMEELLAGLQFSHERGVIHRDIKPTNVMLKPDGGVKIADFGIARIENCSLTQEGTIIGTPAYMSPEQFMAQNVDARTDIYSSGVLLYQMLTGRLPFEGSVAAIMHQALTARPRPASALAGTSSELDAAIERAMRPCAADRFGGAAEFRRALRSVGNVQMDTRVVTRAPGGVPRRRGPASRGVVALAWLVKTRPKSRFGFALTGAAMTGLLTAGVYGWPALLSAVSLTSTSVHVARNEGKFVVFFDAWSASLGDTAHATIAEAAQWALENTSKIVTVEGFAAPDGGIDANVHLSAARAQMVVDQLAHDGVERTRIRLLAHGPTSIARMSDEGRRVEIDIAGP